MLSKIEKYPSRKTTAVYVPDKMWKPAFSMLCVLGFCEIQQWKYILLIGNLLLIISIIVILLHFHLMSEEFSFL